MIEKEFLEERIMDGDELHSLISSKNPMTIEEFYFIIKTNFNITISKKWFYSVVRGLIMCVRGSDITIAHILCLFATQYRGKTIEDNEGVRLNRE